MIACASVAKSEEATRLPVLRKSRSQTTFNALMFSGQQRPASTRSVMLEAPHNPPNVLSAESAQVVNGNTTAEI